MRATAGTLRLSDHLHYLILPAWLLLLSGCGLQSPWSREYHVRQHEQWRIMGDRARLSDNFDLASEYYRKSLLELEQSGQTAVALAAAKQDLAESELLAGHLDKAELDMKNAMQLYKAHSLSESEKQAEMRCQAGCALILLKQQKPDQARAIFDQLSRQGKSRSQDSGKTEYSLACGWPPFLCHHSYKYWLTLCKAPQSESEGAKSELAALLESPDICQPIKQLAAQKYLTLLIKAGKKDLVEKTAERFGIFPSQDTAAASLIQDRWQSACRQGKKFEEAAKTAEARAAYEKALEISRANSTDCPLRYFASLCNLAFFLITNGDPKSALPLLQETVSLQKQRFGEDDRALSMPHSRLGRALLASGEIDKARSEIRSGYELALKGYGEESNFTARAEVILGCLDTVQHNFTEAEKHLRHALSVMAKDPQRNEPSIIDARLTLVDLYKLSGQREECFKAAQEAVDIALETGPFTSQDRALQKLTLVCREQRRSADELNALRQEKEILNSALSSPKWKKWANRRLRIIDTELSSRQADPARMVQQ